MASPQAPSSVRPLPAAGAAARPRAAAAGGPAQKPHQPRPQQQQAQQQQRQQHQAQQQQQHPLAALVAAHFPPMTYGFAYGSGVFDQPDLSHDPGRPAPAPQLAAPPPQPLSGPMIDFIFVVEDPEDWHTQNMERNASHYSFLRHLGPAAVAAAAGAVGAGVWFNTLVPLGGRLVKYGVTSRAAFLEDVTTWQHLYVPGRLHKPVLPLVALRPAAGGPQHLHLSQNLQQFDQQQQLDQQHQQQLDQRLQQQQLDPDQEQHGGPGALGGYAEQLAADRAALAGALTLNLESALRTALLLSPPTAPFRDVARRIAGLSYHGDVRMGLAEDSRKVERIVAGSFPGFAQLYLPLLRDAARWKLPGGAEWVALDGGGGDAAAAGGDGAAAAAAAAAVVRQDTSAEARMHAISALPAALLMRVAARTGVRRPWAAAAAMQAPAGADAAAPWPRSELVAAAAAWRRDVAWAAVKGGRHEQLLHSGLRSIVRASSARQAAVGVLSAGLFKSARYLGAKLAKAWWR
ncbi:phosphatidate, mitochondrial [Raphidocelis subcapitata]|uniref:Phosphatidate cytidylyltransferase, mitochondrial n=1 Tax=Raphidocelis subcapitata TaxID=307507 RepID=A0A2V0NV77_9CHLO|nr:phosphatidate, mitochondrial [Raphidocelis subcapitata]|eukprot:GBF89470.1 phosphatidate, mitochondrial [Raphidocelis subcapitata]